MWPQLFSLKRRWVQVTRTCAGRIGWLQEAHFGAKTLGCKKEVFKSHSKFLQKVELRELFNHALFSAKCSVNPALFPHMPIPLHSCTPKATRSLPEPPWVDCKATLHLRPIRHQEDITMLKMREADGLNQIHNWSYHLRLHFTTATGPHSVCPCNTVNWPPTGWSLMFLSLHNSNYWLSGAKSTHAVFKQEQKWVQKQSLKLQNFVRWS